MDKVQETLRQAYWYMRKDYNDIKEILKMQQETINKLVNEKNNKSQNQKYFISYCAYAENRTDFFNTIINIRAEITNELLTDIEKDLTKELQTESKNYYGTQIINIRPL